MNKWYGLQRTLWGHIRQEDGQLSDYQQISAQESTPMGEYFKVGMKLKLKDFPQIAMFTVTEVKDELLVVENDQQHVLRLNYVSEYDFHQPKCECGRGDDYPRHADYCPLGGG